MTTLFDKAVGDKVMSRTALTHLDAERYFLGVLGCSKIFGSFVLERIRG